MFAARPKHRLDRHHRVLLSYANALAGDPELARDLAQECAVRALRAKTVPREEPAYKAWLFTILRNLWLDHLRKTLRRNEVLIEDADEVAPARIEAEAVVVNVVAVRIAFEQLSAHHRDVLSLVDVGGFSYLETAEVLGISIGTVMSRVSRARGALASLLSQNNVVDLPVRKRRNAR